jgi:SH3 domain protein
MRLPIAALLAALISPRVHAETLYVIEQLYVTVNSAADGTGERVGQIKSADSVELLERQGDQAHVRLPSGAEGWVKASYLSADPPLRQQLNTRVEELEKVRKEKAQLEADLAAARSAVAAATAAAKAAGKEAASHPAPVAAPSSGNPSAAATTPDNAPPAAEIEDANPASGTSGESVSQAPPPLFQDEPMMPARPSWLIASLATLLALGAGFALGWRMLDRRIRAKYGGLRIY